MTNFEKIKSMSEEELTAFFADLSDDLDESPWLNWFNTKYCNHCDSVCEVSHECKYCDDYLSDASIIKLWLKENIE